MDELVSLIVPVYNADEHFPFLVRSLFRQTYENIEFIFVDDGSTNQCLDVLAFEMSQYSRSAGSVRIIHHNTNQGISSSRKDGIGAASGKYLAFADQDDLLDDDFVFQMKSLASDYHADVAICGYTRDMTLNAYEPSPENVICLQPSFCFKLTLLEPGHSMLWNKLFLRQLFLDHDLNAPDQMTNLEDIHVLYRVFYYAKTVVSCSNPYYHWRNNPTSVSHTYSERVLAQAPALINAVIRMEDFIQENMITDASMIKGFTTQETRILIDLALYGQLSFLNKHRALFQRLNAINICSGSYFKWYAKTIALSYRYKMYPLLYLLRFIQRIKGRHLNATAH